MKKCRMSGNVAALLDTRKGKETDSPRESPERKADILNFNPVRPVLASDLQDCMIKKSLCCFKPLCCVCGKLLQQQKELMQLLRKEISAISFKARK